MKQTKAAFRNKPFISLKGSILFLILIPMSGLVPRNIPWEQRGS